MPVRTRTSGRRTLRLRLNTVLLQWFLLFILFTGAVWIVALPSIRRSLIDDRLVLARTIAQSLDVTREHLSRSFAASGAPNLKRVIDLVRLIAAAELGYIDAIIFPENTRPRLIDALMMLKGKRDSIPSRKHGNIPL